MSSVQSAGQPGPVAFHQRPLITLQSEYLQYGFAGQAVLIVFVVFNHLDKLVQGRLPAGSPAGGRRVRGARFESGYCR